MIKKNPIKLWCPPEFKKYIKEKAAEKDTTMSDILKEIAEEGTKEKRGFKKNDKLFPKW